MKNNKLFFYFLVLLVSTSLTSVMAQVSIVSNFGWCKGPAVAGVDPIIGNGSGGIYAATATTAGTNRLLVANVILEDGSDNSIVATAVTYGGQAMTKVVEAHRNGTGTDTYLSLWVLNDAGLVAAAGDVNPNTIAVTWSTLNTSGGEVNCAIFDNVDQTTPIRAFSSGISTPHNPSPGIATTVETTTGLQGLAGELILAAGATANTTPIFTWDNGFTSVFSGPGGFGRSLCATISATASDVIPKYNGSATQARMTIVGAVIKKFGTPPLSVKDNQLAANAINVYPNPTSDVVNIDSSSASEKVINVINSLGQVISTTKASGNAQIDLKSLKVSGFVIVQVIADGKVSNHKVIVK